MGWLAAMLLAGLILSLTGNAAQKGRTWGALLAAWACGVGVLEIWGYYPPPVPAFMMIDGAAAWFVLSRPRSLGQQIIGGVFIVMLAWHLGFWLTDRAGVSLYLQVQLWLGWIQWGVLMIWGGADAGKALGLWPWGSRTLAAVADDVGAD